MHSSRAPSNQQEMSSIRNPMSTFSRLYEGQQGWGQCYFQGSEGIMFQRASTNAEKANRNGAISWISPLPSINTNWNWPWTKKKNQHRTVLLCPNSLTQARRKLWLIVLKIVETFKKRARMDALYLFCSCQGNQECNQCHLGPIHRHESWLKEVQLIWMNFVHMFHPRRSWSARRDVYLT